MAKKHRAMSMEAAMEEERLEIVSMLEKAKPSQRHRKGSTSLANELETEGASGNGIKPLARIDSLDIDDDALSPYNVPAPSPSGFNRPMRSLLETVSIPPVPSSRSAQTSPIEHMSRSLNGTLHPRSQSDAASHPSSIIPRPHGDKVKGDPKSTYSFGEYKPAATSTSTAKAPKRSSSQKRGVQGAMADAIRGELGAYTSGRKVNRHSISGTGLGATTSRSKSPMHRLDRRSFSPGPSILKHSRVLSLEGGAELNKEGAKLLSESAQSKHGSSVLSVGNNERRRTNSGDAVSPGLSRLEKEYFDGDDAAVDSSDEDASRSSDEEGSRGRRKTSISEDDRIKLDEMSTVMEEAHDQDGLTDGKSILANQEADVQLQHQRVQRVKSMLEPEITVTGPGGDRLKNSKPGVHPMNAFDQAADGRITPVDSDTEADISDIKRAQKLAVIMTPIVSTPVTKRCVRTIYRGDFAKMQREAEDNSRRVRKYLVATDLSEEAAHALEWTVGTVLRDGDTLLCIYCVDEEIGIGEATEGSDAGTQPDSMSAMASPTGTTPGSPRARPVAVGPSPLSGAPSRTGSPAPSPMGRGGFRAEAERFRAVEDITNRVSRLLRKTRLQVRVVIEVIHCKSPRHLITEVIDYLNPTLVILGSRGRSALKGVILGSFSNYLVTKSSVPVMVARKKLKKHTKYRRPTIKLANNLTNISGKGLAMAKID